ncbi:hypothetical protein V2J09_003541 [Rumex salicifolius]
MAFLLLSSLYHFSPSLPHPQSSSSSSSEYLGFRFSTKTLWFGPWIGQNIRKLVKDDFIIRKPTKIHSRSRARRMKEAKRKGPVHKNAGVFM